MSAHDQSFHPDFDIRPFASHDERAECVRIQDEIWGEGFTERVPSAILLVGQKIGGVSAGAFTRVGSGTTAGQHEPRMVGFVFGMSGLKDGRLVHWSDMLAVRPEAQGRGLGRALKHFQRDACQRIGVETMYWTYDPFVAKNAYLNLNQLGASIDEFVPNMYGLRTASPVHGSLGTDRFVAAWNVSTEPRPLPSDQALLDRVPVAAAGPGDGPSDLEQLPDAETVAVRIPADYHRLLEQDLERARPWRAAARRAFLHYFPLGFRVSAFVPTRGGDATYLLSRTGPHDAH